MAAWEGDQRVVAAGWPRLARLMCININGGVWIVSVFCRRRLVRTAIININGQ